MKAKSKADRPSVRLVHMEILLALALLMLGFIAECTWNLRLP